MLMKGQKQIRFAIFAIGFFATSFVAMRSSVAQGPDDGIDGARQINSPLVDPAPTPSAIITFRDRDNGSSQSGSGDHKSSVPAGVPEVMPEPRDGRAITAPDKIEWSLIEPEPVLPKNRISGGNVPAIVKPSPSPAVIESQPIENSPPIVQPDFNSTLVFGPESYDSFNSLLSPNYQSGGSHAFRPRGLLGRMRHGRFYVETDPNLLWADYNPCDCDVFSGTGSCYDYCPLEPTERFRAFNAEPDSGIVDLSGRDRPDANQVTFSKRNQATHRAEAEGMAKSELRGGGNPGTSTEMTLDGLFEAIQITKDLPKISSGSFANPPRAQHESAVPMEQILTNSAVVVHPPLVQPYRKNQYTFVVENRGAEAVHNLNLQLAVSNSARIYGALPSESLVSDQAVLFRIDVIPPDGHVEVHVGAVSIDDTPIEFKSTVSVTSTTNFSVTNSKPAVLRQAGTTVHALSSPTQRETKSAAADMKVALPGGSEIVRNPYFSTGTPGRDETAWMKQSPPYQTNLLEPSHSVDRNRHFPLSSDSSTNIVVNFSDNQLNGQIDSATMISVEESASPSQRLVPLRR